jgi:hypothetical protein
MNGQISRAFQAARNAFGYCLYGRYNLRLLNRIQLKMARIAVWAAEEGNQQIIESCWEWMQIPF